MMMIRQRLPLLNRRVHPIVLLRIAAILAQGNPIGIDGKKPSMTKRNPNTVEKRNPRKRERMKKMGDNNDVDIDTN